MKLNVLRFKKIEYEKGLDIQLRVMDMRKKKLIDDTIILLQHPHVLTMGLDCGEGKDSNLLATRDYLEEKGVSLVRTNRGGNITYHGPGQIVGYPIIDLNNHDRDIRQYVYNLEEFFIRMLREEYQIWAGRDKKHRGVWVENDKITALGCSVKKWVTMHGFAFNVNTDMDYFKLINPCGITDKGVTSLEYLTGSRQDEEVAESLVLEYFADIFGYDELVYLGEGIENMLEVSRSGCK